MTDLDALFAGIVADPENHLRWLVLADWLEEFDDPARAELLRLHRQMLGTCTEPDAHPDRAEWQARILELIDLGVKPCVPQRVLTLPGGVPLIGSFIPPGSFLMGGEEYEDERPIHTVTLTKGFFIGIHPLTQAQWRAVMGANPSRFIWDTFPVERVTWVEATEFCERLSESDGCAVRLPTEAEWEYACRAGTTTHYHFGDIPDTRRMNYGGTQVWNGSAVGENRQRTTEVGSYPPNPWGMFDCHGNVGEWCSDRFDAGFYARSPVEDPECRDRRESYRSVRGGTWADDPIGCRAAYRDGIEARIRDDVYGFRIAFDAE